MRLVLSLFPLLFFTACGIEDTTRATKDAVDRTNETSTDIFEQVKRTAELTEELKAILNKTDGAIHLQTLTVAFQNLLAPQNTEFLNPPFKMMPFAEAFSKEATQTELMKALHLLAMDVKFSPPEAKKTRIISLVALSALAAFADTAKFQGILKVEIENHGLYEESAYLAALARYNFTRDYFFTTPLDTATLLNKSHLREAVVHFLNLKFITCLPYVGLLKIDIPAIEVASAVDPNEITAIGRKAKRRFNELLSKEDLNNEEVKMNLNLLAK